MHLQNFDCTRRLLWGTFKQQQRSLVRLSEDLQRCHVQILQQWISLVNKLPELDVRLRKSTKKMGGSSKKKASSGATHRFFNLLTYKLHALGDYFWAILMYGSMDNYSTQVVRRAPFNSFFTNFI